MHLFVYSEPWGSDSLRVQLRERSYCQRSESTEFSPDAGALQAADALPDILRGSDTLPNPGGPATAGRLSVCRQESVMRSVGIAGHVPRRDPGVDVGELRAQLQPCVLGPSLPDACSSHADCAANSSAVAVAMEVSARSRSFRQQREGREGAGEHADP
jgi:hypothetical protein